MIANAINERTTPGTAPPDDGCNLRLWFVLYLLWLGGLAWTARWGMAAAAEPGAEWGWCLWILSLFAFYMSLCCTYFPLPTTWFVLLVASDMFAERVGLTDRWAARVLLVSTLGAISTGLANLNEYHISTFFLRYRRIARVRDTSIYQTAARWFSANPFWVIVLFAFIPIAVDVVRWFAITYRYSRLRFFLGYFVGRWCRYAMLALTSIWLELSGWQIFAIQAALAVLVLSKIFLRIMRESRPTSDRLETRPSHIVHDIGVA